MGLTYNQACLQRILSITAASLSIASGISVLFWWFVILPYRQRYMAKREPHILVTRDRSEFRYHLTIALIMIDLLKSMILITYPIRYFHADIKRPQEEFPHIAVFCDVIGFLTVAIIQSSDFAVLALAIHMALLIFSNGSTGPGNSNSNHNNTNHNSIGSGDDRDKGLYRFRYYIYSIFFVILPIAIASIGLIHNTGYTYFISWCYIVVKPLWYSLLLAWIPRLLIMVLISIIYVSIFIQMKMRMYHVLQAIHRASNYNEDDDSDSSSKGLTLWQSIRVVFRSSERSIQRRRRMRRRLLTAISYLPGFGSFNPVLREPTGPEGRGINYASTIPPTIQELNREYIQKYNYKRHKIERQVNSIFIYPLTYVLLYIFPLIQQCLFYTSGTASTSVPVYWLSLIAAWMRPFNCFVDTCVFVIREGVIPCLSPSRRELRKYDNFSRRQAMDFTNTHAVPSPSTSRGKRTDSNNTTTPEVIFTAGTATTYVNGANNSIIEIAAAGAPLDWEKFEFRSLAYNQHPEQATPAGWTKKQQPSIVIFRDLLDTGPVSPTNIDIQHQSGPPCQTGNSNATNNDPQHRSDGNLNDDDEEMDLVQFLNSFR